MIEEKMYTVSDIARITKLTERTIRNYLASGTLKGHRVGGQWRFTKEDINALFLDSKFEGDMKIKTLKNIEAYYNDKYDFTSNNTACSIINIVILEKEERKKMYKEIKELVKDENKKEQIMFIDDNGHIKIVIIASFDYICKVNEIIRGYVK